MNTPFAFPPNWREKWAAAAYSINTYRSFYTVGAIAEHKKMRVKF